MIETGVVNATPPQRFDASTKSVVSRLATLGKCWHRGTAFAIRSELHDRQRLTSDRKLRAMYGRVISKLTRQLEGGDRAGTVRQAA